MSGLESRSGGRAGRIPWLTYGLLAVCAGVFVAAGGEARRVEGAAAEALREASDYFAQHPYLEPAPALAERLGSAQIARQRRLFREERDNRGAPPIPPGVQRRRQQHLDQRVAEVDSRLEGLPARRWGLRATRPEPMAFFTHAFIHDGWLHLAGNLFLLLLLGLFLERVWGPAAYAPFLVAVPIASAALFAATQRDLEAPLIGMSGTVAGLLGAYLVRFADRWKDGSYVPLAVLGSGWLMLPLWLGRHWPVASEAAAWSEVGGMAFGALAAAAIWFFGAERSRLLASREARLTRLDNPKLDQALRALASGRPDQAFTLLSNLLRRNPEDREVCLALWDVAKELGRPQEAAAGMYRVVRGDLQSGNTEAAVRYWLEFSEYGIALKAEPALLTRMAIALRDARQPAAAIVALHRALDCSDGADGTVIAARVARAARDLDPQIAEAAAWRALGSMDLELEERQSLEDLLAGLARAPRINGPSRPVEPLEISLAESGSECGAPIEPVPIREPEPWEDPELLAECEARSVSDEAEGDAAPAAEPPLRRSSPPRPEPIELEVAARGLEVAQGLPICFAEGGLCVEVAGTGKREVDFATVDAISVAAVHGLSQKPVILVDLVLNWMTLAEEPIRVIRMRGDRFDPRRFAPDRASAVDALRAFSGRLLLGTGATPLPDLQSTKGSPFAVFPDLESYHRDVLMVGEGPVVEFTW